MDEKGDHVLANMERLGAQTVRDLISSGQWPANYNALAKEWLCQKDVEERERKVADSESPMLLGWESNELGHSAREAALDANKRTEDPDKRAEDTDKQVEDANVIARNAKNIAWAAATSVEHSVATAKIAKRIAIAALVAALVAIAIPIATLFIRWPPALEAILYIVLRR